MGVLALTHVNLCSASSLQQGQMRLAAYTTDTAADVVILRPRQSFELLWL